MNKYTVTPFKEASIVVEAESMVVGERSVTLFSGSEIKAYFPHVESVVVDSVKLPTPHAPVNLVGAVDLPTAVAITSGFVDLPPAVSIGSIYITAGPGTDVKAVADALAELVRGQDRGDA